MEKHIILKLEFQRTWMRIMCVGFGESRLRDDDHVQMMTIIDDDHVQMMMNMHMRMMLM